jgi:hypothetical protein
MANERDNLNHLRSSVPYKKQTPIIDSGFSSKDFTESSLKKTSICVCFFLALQLASTSPLLPINSTQQSIEESAILRTLRMNALHVCSF